MHCDLILRDNMRVGSVRMGAQICQQNTTLFIFDMHNLSVGHCARARVRIDPAGYYGGFILSVGFGGNLGHHRWEIPIRGCKGHPGGTRTCMQWRQQFYICGLSIWI